MPGVLLSRHLDKGLIQRLNFQRDPYLFMKSYSQNNNNLGLSIFQLISVKVYILYHLKGFLPGLIQAENGVEIQAKK